MSDFADVERFAREHTGCGGLTPSAMPKPGGGGYLLTISCACGSTFDRWVSSEDARRPLPLPARAARPPAASGPPAPAPVAPCPTPVVPVMPGAAPSPATAPVSALTPASRARAVSRVPEVSRPRPRPSADSPLQHQANPPPPSPRAQRGSRGYLVWLALFAIVGGGGAAVLYTAADPDGPLPRVARWSRGQGPRGGDGPRAALEGVVKALRELHAVAASTTSVSVYAARVTAVRTDAERFLSASAPGATRTRVREALDIHLLAVSAWRAKSLDQKDAWEAVGLDPSIGLCPPLRLVADFAAQPEGVSRAQARGAAVASALPLLWECANERVAALEQALAAR